VLTDSEGLERSPFVDFTRDEWAALRAATPLTLTQTDLDSLRGLNEPIAMREVEEVYLPLSRLLNLRFAATRELHAATTSFLGQLHQRAPFVVAVAGSVAVGKSTISRILQALLGRWPDHPRVDLVTTDGFLYPNAVLEAKGLMARKGFPESYDVRNLLRFLVELKSGKDEVRVPVYSHLTYDIVDGEEIVLRGPDICLIEGLNLLQTPTVRAGREPSLVVSDFFDFAIYIDADERDVESWYVERFLALRDSAFRDSRSFFHHFTQYSEEDARAIATSVWREINGVNLRDNIEPTKGRADLILEKGRDHAVERVRLRKL
jgi:type I pantothenate kinase